MGKSIAMKKEIEEIMDDVRENDQCLFFVGVTIIPVSYTHLDVYKRQRKDIL